MEFQQNLYLEQLQNRHNNIVDVAEARRFGLLRVVHPSGPIDDNFRAVVDAYSATNRPTGVAAAIVEQTIKHGAVLADIEPLRREGSDRESRRGARRALWRAAVTASRWMFSPMVAGLMSRRKLRYSSEWKRAICSNVAGSGRYTASFEYSP